MFDEILNDYKSVLFKFYEKTADEFTACTEEMAGLESYEIDVLKVFFKKHLDLFLRLIFADNFKTNFISNKLSIERFQYKRFYTKFVSKYCPQNFADNLQIIIFIF